MTEQYTGPEYALQRSKRISKITKYVIVTALSGAILAGTTGCVRADPFIEKDPSIESITVHNGANIRSEPNVPNEYDPGNIVETADETMTVGTPGGTDIRDIGGSDSKWYKVTVESMKKADPDFDAKGDSDGFVWVNEQRATPNR